MSVIVKGMKMPKNCLHCDFDDSYGICACRNEAPYVCEYSAKQRPSWCPLEELPSAQPETHEERTETHGVCLDAISRQAAIDALDCISGVEEVLRSLPSAQPSPCEFCKHNDTSDDLTCLWCMAERRTDGN